MKRIFLLTAAAFLLVNCTDTKDSKTDRGGKDSTETTTPKKKDAVKKPDVKDMLDTPKEDLKKDDASGWPEERRQDVLNMCRQDATGMPEKMAAAYCNCQLGNLTKLFDSYKEAVTLFNKTEDQLSEADIKKAEMFAEADESCWNQNVDNNSGDEEEDDIDK